LGLATLEHQQQLSQVSSVNLSALIQTQISHLSQKAHALQANIHAACSPTLILQADEFLLGQAIYNLLENALDFSPRNSVIHIDVTEENQQILITVKDQGVGIPDYALDKVFDKFYSLPRPDNSINAGQKSTGLGLNFVQEVAKLHRGNVSLKNHADSGAIAVITLPM
jgi:two-component system, OmpR family, sensor histidine kinase CreC